MNVACVFRHSVVMAVATPTHAGDQIVVAKEVLPVVASELAALVGVNGDSLFGLPAPQAISRALRTSSVSMRWRAE